MISWLLGCDADVAGRSFTLTVLDAVDGSSTGIAMCHISMIIQELTTTAFGTKQTSDAVRNNVRFWG
jgi:hypothetical protein